MEDDIHAKLYGALKIGCHKGIVHNGKNAIFFRNPCNRLKISDRQQWVCWTLHKDCLNFWGEFLFQRCKIGGILNGIADSKILKNLIQHAKGSAVNIAGDDHSVP